MKAKTIYDRKRNGVFTVDAYKAYRHASIEVSKILEKLRSEGWTKDQAEYLVINSVYRVNVEEMMTTNNAQPTHDDWDAIRDLIAETKHGDE